MPDEVPMARLSQVSLRFAFAFIVIAVVLISGLQLDSHLKSNKRSFGIAPAFAATAPKLDPKDDVAATARLSSSYGKLPISFEPNEGQTAEVVQYLARGAGYTLFLTPGEMVLTLHASLPGTRKPHGARLLSAITSPAVEGAEKSAAVRMWLIGANKHAQALRMDLLPGKSNYLTGSDPAKWHTDIPTYAKVRYQDVYPGIDLVYYGNQEGRLEHDFVVAPGADPNQIEFDLRDQDRMPALKNGELTLPTNAGDLRLRAPVAYQVIGGERRRVAATYQAAGSGPIRFRLGLYDKQLPLVIDPVLVYSAVFGSSGTDYVRSIAIDTARDVYVTGWTFWNESTPNLAFVSKLNSSGTALVYSTYLGGTSGGSFALAMAVDGNGRAYLSGVTESRGFPVVNAYQFKFGGGGYDSFISVLNPAGNGLEWSTYLGGANDDWAIALALDPSGNVYATGITWGWSTFPELHSIPGGTQCNTNPECNWVAKFSSAGTLQYATLSGAASVLGFSATSGFYWAIAADSNGSAYITGVASIAPPTTPGAFRSTCAPGRCAFVAKLSPIGDSLVYSTTLGTIAASVEAIAVDSGGNAYVGGSAGPGLPVWSTGFQRTFGGGDADGMVIKLNATGTNLIWSTYLGGSGDDSIQSLVLDQYRQVYVSGYTSSPDFPLKSPVQTYTGTIAAPYQYFVTTLSASLSSIPYYSTYFGSETNTFQPPGAIGLGQAKIAVDPALNVYLAGQDQNNVQSTPGAYSVGSSRDIFISKLVIMDDLSLTLNSSPSPVAHGSNLTYTLAVTSKGPDFGVNVRVSDTLPAGTTFVSYDAGGGTCTAPPVGSTGTLNCRLTQLNKGATWNVKLTVHVNAASGTTLSNMAATISNMQDFVIGNNSATIATQVSELAIMDDLSIAVTTSSPSVAPGDGLVYSISVTSKGPDGGTNVRISDTLPAGFDVRSEDCAGGTFWGTGTTPGCTLPGLRKGATWTVNFGGIVRAAPGTTLTNTAITFSDMPDFVIGNNSATITTPVN
jgi:uncharacterized repeat protein (TIGR01451 family)